MADTTLSPRLRHLLIKADPSGKLILPDGCGLSPTSSSSPERRGLPPSHASGLISPISAYTPSPLDQRTTLPSLAETTPVLLPRPSLPSIERLPSQSVFALLDGRRSVPSPPSSSESGRGARPLLEQQQRRPSPIGYQPPRHDEDRYRASFYPSSAPEPKTAPLPYRASSSSSSSSMAYSQPRYHPYSPPVHPYPSPSSYPAELRRSPPHAATLHPARPELPRRHSDHPPTTSVRYAHEDPAYAPMIGSRAPISRTTKACNACRSRKVRCDAGIGSAESGSGGGEPSTCSRCREAGVACVYSGMQKKRGPCPGSIRPPSSSQRGPGLRRPSTHGSMSSTATYISTPPDEYPPPTPTIRISSSSHGAPSYTPISGWTSSQPRPLEKPRPSVVGWPGDIIEEDREDRPGSAGYGHRWQRREERGGGLAPLRVAIDTGRRSSFFDH